MERSRCNEHITTNTHTTHRTIRQRRTPVTRLPQRGEASHRNLPTVRAPILRHYHLSTHTHTLTHSLTHKSHTYSFTLTHTHTHDLAFDTADPPQSLICLHDLFSRFILRNQFSHSNSSHSIHLSILPSFQPFHSSTFQFNPFIHTHSL